MPKGMGFRGRRSMNWLFGLLPRGWRWLADLATPAPARWVAPDADGVSPAATPLSQMAGSAPLGVGPGGQLTGVGYAAEGVVDSGEWVVGSQTNQTINYQPSTAGGGGGVAAGTGGP